MKSIINRFGTELVLVGMGQAGIAIGAIVGVRLMTGALPPDIYGEVWLATSFATLIQQLFTAPLSGTFSRYYNFAVEKGELGEFFASGAFLALCISLATAGLFGIGALVLWLSGQAGYLGILVFTLIFALFSGINALLDGIQSAARQRAVVAWHQSASQWLRFIIAVGLVSLLGKRSQFAMAGYAISAILVLLSQFYFFWRKFKGVKLATIQPDGAWNKRMLKFSLPFASWGFFTWLELSSDRWALETFSTTQAVGYYGVLNQLGYYPLMLLSTVITQFAQPVLYQQAGDGTQADRVEHAQRNTRRMLALAFGMTALTTAAAALLHPLVFQLFAGPSYRLVSGYQPAMVLAGGLFACGQIASLTQLNRGDSKALLGPKIGMGLVGTLLNIAGAYFFGLPGVVYASVIFSILYLLWVLVIYYRNKRYNSVTARSS